MQPAHKLGLSSLLGCQTASARCIDICTATRSLAAGIDGAKASREAIFHPNFPGKVSSDQAALAERSLQSSQRHRRKRSLLCDLDKSHL